MTPAFENWFMVFVIVMTLSVFMQMAIFMAMFLAQKRLAKKVEDLLDRDVTPLLGEAKSLIADGRKTMAHVQTTSEEIAGFARTQTVRIDGLLDEAVERARLQMIRTDEIVSDALNRVEMTTEQVHRTVTKPIRELQAVISGVRTAFEFFGGKRRQRAPGERSTQDEEMFI